MIIRPTITTKTAAVVIKCENIGYLGYFRSIWKKAESQKKGDIYFTVFNVIPALVCQIVSVFAIVYVVNMKTCS